MIVLDEGSLPHGGTAVGPAVVLAALIGEEIQIINIGAQQEEPGLPFQSLKEAEAVAELCQGQLDGALVGSQELRLRPGRRPLGSYYEWDLGPSGSATSLAMAVAPIAAFALVPSTLHIDGGLFRDGSLSVHYIHYVLLPLLRRMGLGAELLLERPGYAPEGTGAIEMRVYPAEGTLQPLKLPEQPGQVKSIWGIALASHTRLRRVAERIASQCRETLREQGYNASIRALYDDRAQQPGAVLDLFVETTAGCILGAHQAGNPHRTPEDIGEFVAHSLLGIIATGASVDTLTAESLILYGALAKGTTHYTVPQATPQLLANLWLVERLLGAKTELSENRVSIEGIGYQVRV